MTKHRNPALQSLTKSAAFRTRVISPKEPTETVPCHTFLWAMQRLKERKKVRFKRWQPGAYVQINEHNIAVFHYSLDQQDAALRGDLGLMGCARSWPGFMFDWTDMRRSEWSVL